MEEPVLVQKNNYLSGITPSRLPAEGTVGRQRMFLQTPLRQMCRVKLPDRIGTFSHERDPGSEVETTMTSYRRLCLFSGIDDPQKIMFPQWLIKADMS